MTINQDLICLVPPVPQRSSLRSKEEYLWSQLKTCCSRIKMRKSNSNLKISPLLVRLQSNLTHHKPTCQLNGHRYGTRNKRKSWLTTRKDAMKTKSIRSCSWSLSNSRMKLARVSSTTNFLSSLKQASRSKFGLVTPSWSHKEKNLIESGLDFWKAFSCQRKKKLRKLKKLGAIWQ